MHSPSSSLMKPTKAPRRAVSRALLRKEWQEQRWRFFLGTIVLSALLAGMLRAQTVPANEAAVLIYWPAGVLIAVFLAMGPVAAERSDRTWEFLVAQPVSRAQVLMAKWRAGLVQLVGIMAIATSAGALALASRGVRVLPEHGSLDLSKRVYEGMSGLSPGETEMFLRIVNVLQGAPVSHPVLWLCLVGLVSTVALACFYTPLFFILSRARNEFHAGLGGILLTIAVHIWLGQFVVVSLGSEWLLLPALLNPIAPLVLMRRPDTAAILPVVVVIHVMLWIIIPCVIVRLTARKAVSR